MSDDLMGKTALVTGGGRGIGRAICVALAEAGCNIVVHDRMQSADLAAFAAGLAADLGVRTAVATADFLHAEEILPLFDHVDTFSPHLDILVNNAGFETTFAAEDMPLEAWQAVLQVNLGAPFQCAQQAARRMKDNGGGMIVNVTSIHDSVPRKGLSHYCAAKAGLRMLGHCTALEWAEYGIRVVNVSPGAIETDMNREAIETFGRDKFEQWIPAGRLGHTGDVANVVRFLCSNAASYITATDICIDGGYMRNLVRYDDRPGRT